MTGLSIPDELRRVGGGGGETPSLDVDFDEVTSVTVNLTSGKYSPNSNLAQINFLGFTQSFLR